MGNNYIIYLAEIGITVVALIVGMIIFKVKHKNGFLKFLGVCISVFVIFFGITFILEKPEIESKSVEIIEAKSNNKIKKASTTYHFKNITDKVRITGNIDYDKVGEYKIQYEVDTLLGTYTKDMKVEVIDTEAPEIVLEGEENYNLSYTKEYEEPGYKAIDKYEGDLTENVTVTREDIDDNKFNIKYEVQDSSGNKAKKVRQVSIVDDIPPKITLNGNSKITTYLSTEYKDKGATAKDEKDGDLTNEIKVEGEVDTLKEGTYTLTYKVADRNGNEATETRTVVVKKYVQKVKSDVQGQDGSTGNKGVIYLTFDDGPSSDITPKILDILKEKNVQATFFILNYNASGEQLVKREYAEGHTVAIHGYSHKYADIYQSEEAYMSNITKLQDKIKASIGYNATITRFPGGSSNTVSRYNPGIMTRLCKLVVERGYKYFDWNISSGDAGGAKNASDVYNNVTRGLSKSKQNVVLMHDFGGNTKTLNALADIIDYGKQNGYIFSKITEDTPMVTHTPNN